MRLARAEQRDRAGAAYKKLRIQRLLHDAMVITTEVTLSICTQNAEALLPVSRQMQSLHLRGAFISARYLVLLVGGLKTGFQVAGRYSGRITRNIFQKMRFDACGLFFYSFQLLDEKLENQMTMKKLVDAGFCACLWQALTVPQGCG